MSIDPLFFAAVSAFGWGLNLAIYRLAAERLGWPMGVVHSNYPVLPAAVGLLGMLAGLGHALAGTGKPGVATLLVAGMMFGLFWTGFMRVASQAALLLTPIAIALLIFVPLVRTVS